MVFLPKRVWRTALITLDFVFGLVISLDSKVLIAKEYYQEGVMAVDQSEMSKAIAIQAIHEAALMKISGVVGIGIGLSEKSDHPAIHVFVDATTPLYSPAAIPKQLEGVPVIIIEGGEIKAH